MVIQTEPKVDEKIQETEAKVKEQAIIVEEDNTSLVIEEQPKTVESSASLVIAEEHANQVIEEEIADISDENLTEEDEAIAQAIEEAIKKRLERLDSIEKEE